MHATTDTHDSSLHCVGSLPPLPRFTPSSVSRSVKGENGPYFDLEKAFKEDGNWNRVSEQHRAVLTQVQDVCMKAMQMMNYTSVAWLVLWVPQQHKHVLIILRVKKACWH